MKNISVHFHDFLLNTAVGFRGPVFLQTVNCNYAWYSGWDIHFSWNYEKLHIRQFSQFFNMSWFLIKHDWGTISASTRHSFHKSVYEWLEGNCKGPMCILTNIWHPLQRQLVLYVAKVNLSWFELGTAVFVKENGSGSAKIHLIKTARLCFWLLPQVVTLHKFSETKQMWWIMMRVMVVILIMFTITKMVLCFIWTTLGGRRHHWSSHGERHACQHDVWWQWRCGLWGIPCCMGGKQH